MVGCFGFEFILIGVKKGGVRVCVCLCQGWRGFLIHEHTRRGPGGTGAAAV